MTDREQQLERLVRDAIARLTEGESHDAAYAAHLENELDKVPRKPAAACGARTLTGDIACQLDPGHAGLHRGGQPRVEFSDSHDDGYQQFHALHGVNVHEVVVRLTGELALARADVVTLSRRADAALREVEVERDRANDLLLERNQLAGLLEQTATQRDALGARCAATCGHHACLHRDRPCGLEAGHDGRHVHVAGDRSTALHYYPDGATSEADVTFESCGHTLQTHPDQPCELPTGHDGAHVNGDDRWQTDSAGNVFRNINLVAAQPACGTVREPSPGVPCTKPDGHDGEHVHEAGETGVAWSDPCGAAHPSQHTTLTCTLDQGHPHEHRHERNAGDPGGPILPRVVSAWGGRHIVCDVSRRVDLMGPGGYGTIECTLEDGHASTHAGPVRW